MRVLVTGDRNGFYDQRLRVVLDHIRNDMAKGDMVLIEGGARGVDTQAKQWAIDSKVEYIEFPAKWEELGRRAGPIRNAQMLSEGNPDLVVAFHHNIDESKGTADMVKKAERAGIPVQIYK